MSKMKMQAVVASIEARTVKEGTPDQRVIYDVIDSDGVKWTAWERDLAVLAHSFTGQQSIWEVEQKQNGKYTNRTLLNIGPLGNAAMEKAIGTFEPGSASSSGTIIEPGNASNVTFAPAGTTITPKDTSIHRQTAAKCVSWMAASGAMTPDEFWGNVENLVTYFETGQRPGQVSQVSQGNVGTHPMSAVDAAFFETPTDDDIPF